MKRIIKKSVGATLLSGSLLFIGFACKDSFLSLPPTGQLSNAQLSSNAGIQNVLISSYAALNGRTGSWFSSSFNWLWGSITGGEANKGSNAGDQSVAIFVQNFTVSPTTGPLDDKWNSMYDGISRANATLNLVATADPTVTAATKTNVTAQARFLRGHYHFELRRLFGNVPYIDETVSYGNGIDKVKNDVEIYPKIEADFKFAYDNLPETQDAAGRANKWAAAAYLAKVYMYQKKFADAKALFDLIIANGKTANGQKYALLAKFPDVYNAANSNNSEAVFSIQNAVGTGSVANANPDMVLNFPYNGGPAGCCGFFQPSFDMANSFRVDANGLPLLTGNLTDQAAGVYSQPTNELKTDQGLLSTDPFTPDTRPVDPRLDYSVGRRGIPYLDWGPHPGFAWIRDQTYGGPYAPKKFVYPKAQSGTLTDNSSWTNGYSTINFNIISFADVLLMAAEAEVEVGSLEKARQYVNQIRTRASNPAAFVVGADGKPAANYVISTYTTPFASQVAARNAVYFERKLELSGEGHRFFDLVRWGIAAPAINAFLGYESTKLPGTYAGAKFTAGKNEYMPISQNQLNLQPGVLKQNPGY